MPVQNDKAAADHAIDPRVDQWARATMNMENKTAYARILAYMKEAAIPGADQTGIRVDTWKRRQALLKEARANARAEKKAQHAARRAEIARRPQNPGLRPEHAAVHDDVVIAGSAEADARAVELSSIAPVPQPAKPGKPLIGPGRDGQVWGPRSITSLPGRAPKF